MELAAIGDPRRWVDGVARPAVAAAIGAGAGAVLVVLRVHQSRGRRRRPSSRRCARACMSAPALDAHRVASYNPFVALQWMLDGKTVGGLSTRGPDETPSREDALRLYTVGSAWFCFDELRRGTLENGKLADFAILNQDFMSVPVEQIGATTSLLTVVGGKVVYATDVFSSVK